MSEKLLTKGELECIVDIQKKNSMVSFAENFFRRIDEQKQRQRDICTQHRITAMRKTCRRLKPYMKKHAVKFIVSSEPIEHPEIWSIKGDGKCVFMSESFREAKNKWVYLQRKCDWYDLLAVNCDGVKWRVHWCYYDYYYEKVIKFFGEDGEAVREILKKLDQWWRGT